jgi:putative transposase
MSPRHTPQLKHFNYHGPYRYLLTICTSGRARLFTRPDVVATALSEIRNAARRTEFALLAYCFMPDHVHLCIEGADCGATVRKFVTLAKQLIAFRLGRGCWQAGFHDRVLRRDEATIPVCLYIWNNPVRAGLVEWAGEYPYSGSDTFEFPAVLRT